MRKGFTLIELLAIIIILAIIALITTPMVLNFINTSSESAFLNSAYGYIESAKLYYSTHLLSTQSSAMIDILEKDANDNYIIKYSGEIPDSGKISFNINGKTSLAVRKGNFCATKKYEDEKITLTKIDEDVECILDSNGIPKIIQPFKDENPGVICSDTLTENYANSTSCYINSIEDLVAFSTMVNSGSSFYGKTVYLMRDLDFNSNKSYTKASSSSMGDLNGDSIIQSIKEEMTSSYGFNPIGGSNKKFSGTFDGNGFTISNLMINRPDTDYIGLFGYAETPSIIRGLTLVKTNIKGNNNVGSLVGYDDRTTISAILLDGDNFIEGNTNVGGVIGYNRLLGQSGLVANANVKGNNYVGLLTGYSSGVIKGIVESGSVTALDTTKTNQYIGKATGEGAVTAFINEHVTMTALTEYTAGTRSANDGIVMKDISLNDINHYDAAIDTLLGGDNNSDSYYFDYDSNSNIIIKTLEENPFDISNLNGTGTTLDPYLIQSKADMRILAANCANVSGKYIKLMNDLDYTNDKFYSIGTSAKIFNGKFLGNGKTLSNITINGYNYVGVFGNINSAASIVGLTLKNINITGNDDVGGLVGYSAQGTVSAILLEGTNNITGNSYVGGLYGYNHYTTSNSFLINANISGNDHLGLIAGKSLSYGLSGIVESGSVTALDTTKTNQYIGKATGEGAVTAFINEHVTMTALTEYTAGTRSANDGIVMKDISLNDINYYDAAIDTLLGGDNNSDSYYFDYDSNSNIIIKTLEENPFDISNLNGTGTTLDPYLIQSKADMRILAANCANVSGKYIKLMNDLDYTNDKFYSIGTSAKIFNGKFLGNGKTLSNITINGYNHAAVFGYVNQALAISGLTLRNINVTGNTYVGGLIGYSSKGTISNIILEGTNNITGDTYVGGMVGYNHAASSASAIINANVIGNNYLGLITGFSTLYEVKGIVESGSVKVLDSNANDLNIGKITGGGSVSAYVNESVGNIVYYQSGATIDTTTQTRVAKDGTSQPSTFLNDLSIYSNMIKITAVNNGYYFGMNSDNTDIIIKTS